MCDKTLKFLLQRKKSTLSEKYQERDCVQFKNDGKLRSILSLLNFFEQSLIVYKLISKDS